MIELIGKAVKNKKLDDAFVDQYVETLKAELTAGLKQYRQDYATYYKNCKRPGFGKILFLR